MFGLVCPRFKSGKEDGKFEFGLGEFSWIEFTAKSNLFLVLGRECEFSPSSSRVHHVMFGVEAGAGVWVQFELERNT